MLLPNFMLTMLIAELEKFDSTRDGAGSNVI